MTNHTRIKKIGGDSIHVLWSSKSLRETVMTSISSTILQNSKIRRMSKILKNPPIYRTFRWLRSIWSNGLSSLKNFKKMCLGPQKMIFYLFLFEKSRFREVKCNLCLKDQSLEQKLRFPNLENLKKKSLWKWKDWSFFFLKDQFLKKYS